MDSDVSKCPFCGADMQENASFCLHCMRSLDEKEKIKKEKIFFGRKRIIIFAAAALLIIAAVVCFLIIRKPSAEDPPKNDVISDDTPQNDISAQPKESEKAVDTDNIFTSPYEFCAAAILVSEKLGCNELWSPDELKETHRSLNGKSIKLWAPVSIPDAVMAIYFDNCGETVDFILEDVPEEYLEDAKNIAICAVDAACNSYFSDVSDVFFDDKVFPKKKCDIPFIDDFTDLEKRTEIYNSDIENGCDISTNNIDIAVDSDRLINYYLTSRDYGDRILYDMCLHFEMNDQ